MDTKNLREKVKETGAYCMFICDELLSADSDSEIADNYICYSHFFSHQQQSISKSTGLCNRNYGQAISYLDSGEDYTSFGNHLPISCFDFFLRTRIEREEFFLLIKRDFWPMYSQWWPVGGRRMLPDFCERADSQWTLVDEILFKLHDDLGLQSQEILSISKMALSDHYHQCYRDVTRTRLIKRRVTPVTSFLVDIVSDSGHRLKMPQEEAAELRWFSKHELIEYLKCDDGSFSNHLRVLLASTLNVEFILKQDDLSLWQTG